MFVDHYAILEVSRNATDAQIKAAYRERAFLYHPDRNSDPSAHQKFLNINEAYRILSDQTARQKYDRLHDRHHGRKTKTTSSANSFESLERTRAKRSSRYSRSMYSQRMRYRGGSVSSTPSSSTNGPRKKPPTRTHSNRYEKIKMEEAEASHRGFSSLSKVLRSLCIVSLLFSGFLLLDKGLAIEKAREVVISMEPVPWSFTQPNVIQVKTRFSSFGVQRREAERMTIGDYVRLKKSIFANVPVQAIFLDYGDRYLMDTYGGRYDSPFELIWISVILCTLALIFRKNPQSSTYLSTGAIFVSLNIFGAIFLV